MLLRARVSLLDRPGALLAVAKVIADIGGNIVDIEILATGDGRVVDDLVLELPDTQLDTFRTRLSATGAELTNVRRTVRVSGQRPDLDLLHRVALAPGEALGTIVSLAPPIWSSDWAAVVETGGSGTPLRASPGAPSPLPPDLPEPIGPLPRRGVVDGPTGQRFEVVGMPWGQGVLYLGRLDGPTYLQMEMVQIRRVIELAAILAGEKTPAT